MNSPNNSSKPEVAGWTPETPVSVPPLLMWPPRPAKILKYLFGFPGLYFPWIAIDAILALGLWALLLAGGADLASVAPGGIARIFGSNLIMPAAFYGGWHPYLYGRRVQGTRFKYNPRWPAAEDRSFLFGRPAISNVFWSLGSG